MEATLPGPVLKILAIKFEFLKVETPNIFKSYVVTIADEWEVTGVMTSMTSPRP